ncbi:hypothetical protein PanWU01x14_299230 [Parasponia andersonii]|uniref:Uncharacterized protein n=1 Tax=Parasponia andersonii TaxID=3476 RepID=A0A2P5AUD4_PARAD|nr:hypothetical protein PanWU01x14_299230 [Parasponia andersonii]
MIIQQFSFTNLKQNGYLQKSNRLESAKPIHLTRILVSNIRSTRDFKLLYKFLNDSMKQTEKSMVKQHFGLFRYLVVASIA